MDVSMNMQERFAWVMDYDGDVSRVCWASDSGAAIDVCDCAQCVEARQVLPFLLENQGLRVKLSQVKNELAALKASIETIEEVWREQVAGYMGDWAEDSLLNTLAAEFDFEATEEVNITITIEVGATITKPVGADVNYHDFDIDTLEISANVSGWEMDLGDPEITDVN